MATVRGASAFASTHLPMQLRPTPSLCRLLRLHSSSLSLLRSHKNVLQLSSNSGTMPGTLRQYHQFANSKAKRQNPSLSKSSLRHNINSKVIVELDGRNLEFSAVLLRDLCQCPECVHESTRQRLFSTTDIPPEIGARAIMPSSITPKAIDIFWNGDVPGFDINHKTTLEIDALRSLASSGATPGPFSLPPAPPVPWDAASSNLIDFEYHSYMQDDATLLQTIEQLQTHGLAFVTEVPSIEKSVSNIAERIGPVKDTFYGYTWDVRTVPKAINAAYTSKDLGFHTDLLYFDAPPHIQLLHCMQSSSSGGASVFADAFKCAVDLYEADVDAFNILATTPVNYHYKHPDSNLYSTTKPVFDLRPLRIGGVTYHTLPKFLSAWEDQRQKSQQSTGIEVPRISAMDCLEKINWGPPFLAPFSIQLDSMGRKEDLSSVRGYLNDTFDEWHAAARKFSALLERPEILYERLMRPGECVLFNNTRVLHSRRAFNAEDAGKPRWLRGTYVDKDPFFSKLRVLSHKSRESSI